ncbi:MAG: hypothetical protein H5T86_08505 [Armatimonadetes bacterium]|nr:hypothetical protein [Armatimonadota bacterium]
MRNWALAVACGLVLCRPLWAEQVRLSVIADTSLQAHETEREFNSGASSVIRIKAWQHFMLLKCDLSPIRGWRIDSARLYLHLARPDHCLWRVGLSTITSDWREGTGTGSQQAVNGCSFYRAIAPDVVWAWPDSDFIDVAFGLGGSFMEYTQPREVGGGWLEVEVEPRLVAAMLHGGSYGLCISDEKGQTLFNNDVHSREQAQFQPYMIVSGASVAPGRPPEIRSVEAVPYFPAADFNHGALRITFPAPEPFAVTYRMRARGPDGERELPRWMLPSPAAPGEPLEVIFRGKPDAEYSFSLVAVSETGAMSEPAHFRCRTSTAVPRPEPMSAPDAHPVEAGEAVAGTVAARVFPGEVKVSPVTGEALEKIAPAREVVLEAARNEVVAFQVALAGPPEVSEVAISDLVGPNGARIPARAARWYLEWPVNDGGWWPDYAVPLHGSFPIPWPQGRVPEARWQPLLCDIYVPKSAQPGVYLGQVTVSAAAERLGLPVSLTVHNFTMPDICNFEVDFNCYGPVYSDADWAKYVAVEREYYRACHEHRITLNPLPYSQSGRVYRGWAPEVKVDADGVAVADWGLYDEHYGPYLDGSAFTGYRAGIPISHMYLPLHENWPVPIDPHYAFRPAEQRYPQVIFEHARLAPPIEKAFDDAFKQGFQLAARAFVDHFRERRWIATDLQCYMNNKHFYKDPAQGGRGTSWWCLDEPMCTDDFLALRFFGQLFRDGVGEARPVPVVFRADISRPEWQRTFLDGITDLECVSGALWQYGRRLMDMQRRWGVRFWHYGTANPAHASNLSAEAWAVRAYLAGADGILPWNVIGGDGALDRPSQTALLVPGDRFGILGPVVSLRVKAFRRAQQDVELLIALSQKRGWRREQTAAAIAPLLALEGKTIQQHALDAGTLQWEKLEYDDFARLRRALYAALDE